LVKSFLQQAPHFPARAAVQLAIPHANSKAKKLTDEIDRSASASIPSNRRNKTQHGNKKRKEFLKSPTDLRRNQEPKPYYDSRTTRCRVKGKEKEKEK
jgi:hypothetical protein